MMRRPRRPSTACKRGAICSSALAVAVLALTLALTQSPGADVAPAGASLGRADTVASRADARPATRRLHVTLAVAPDDLALAQISFGNSSAPRLSARSLRVAVSGPFGDDYLAAAALRLHAGGTRRALVALVNRPSPLLDPVSVRLSLTAWRSLGEPAVRTLADAFARGVAARKPALCDLRLHGVPLTGSDLSVLGVRGSPLSGFAAASAVAQAYDVACGLPYEDAFVAAVEHASGASPSPTPTEPTPAPPVGKVPGEGCEPAPGRACPLAVRSASTPAGDAGAH